MLVSKLKKTKTKFLHCIGYLNSIRTYKARFIANIKYCEKVCERSGKNLFWSIKYSGESLDKLKARDFNVTSLSTHDFSILNTTLPQYLIKDKLFVLIERAYKNLLILLKEPSIEKALLILHVTTETHF